MPALKPKLNLCESCHGTGLQLDPVTTGKSLRKLRQACGVSMHELSRRMGISAVYLWNLEKGRRRWTRELADKFRECVTE